MTIQNGPFKAHIHHWRDMEEGGKGNLNFIVHIMCTGVTQLLSEGRGKGVQDYIVS
jgi:hypothetical protein